MSLALRERQVEKAWREHRGDSDRDRVPEAARRATRAFRASLAGDAGRIKAAYEAAPLRALINTYLKKGTVGRERILQRIRTALADAASVEDIDGALRLMWLQSHVGAAIPNYPSLAQAGVVVGVARLVRAGGGIDASAFAALEASDHCLARLYQRSPGIDVAAALRDAAHGFIAADVEDVAEAMRRRATLCLPAANGLLLSSVIAGDDRGKVRPIARANTWIAAELAGSDQHPIAKASTPERCVLAAAVRGG